MKKLSLLFAFGLLFLVGCSNEMSGPSTTVCTNAPASVVSTADDVVVTIIGYDEDIITWTERMTMSPAAYTDFFFGFEMSLEDISEFFTLLEEPIEGESWHLISINEDTMVFELRFDYNDIPLATLNGIWGTTNFHNEVTLSAAIAGLNDADASCN